MKKTIIITVTLILIAWAAAQAQQFTTQTNTTVTIPVVVWRGSNAQVIASQLLALTNANGSLVIPAGLLTNRSSLITIRVDVGTNGTLRSIRAIVR